jgi:hypothetical protein
MKRRQLLLGSASLPFLALAGCSDTMTADANSVVTNVTFADGAFVVELADDAQVTGRVPLDEIAFASGDGAIDVTRTFSSAALRVRFPVNTSDQSLADTYRFAFINTDKGGWGEARLVDYYTVELAADGEIVSRSYSAYDDREN